MPRLRTRGRGRHAWRGSRARKRGSKPSYRELLTKDVLLFFCGFIAFNICLLAVLSLVPSILQTRGMDVSLSGFVSTLPMIISVASSPLFGMLSDKTGKTKWLLVFCLFFLGPCTFVLYNFEGAVMWIGAVVMGVIGMGTTGLMITAFMKVISRPEACDHRYGRSYLRPGNRTVPGYVPCPGLIRPIVREHASCWQRRHGHRTCRHVVHGALQDAVRRES